MKHKYKKFLLLATLLILALCMGALGVYHGVILPNSSELQTKRALDVVGASQANLVDPLIAGGYRQQQGIF